MDTASVTSDDSPEQLAAQAQALIQRSDFSAAERLVRDKLGDVVEDKSHVEALYTLAVAERYQKKLDEALSTLARLLKLDPGFARAYQERGHTLLAANRPDDALLAFEQATRSNPALLASWKAQVNLCKDAGRPIDAGAANQQLEFLSQLPKELLTVASLLNEDKLYRAERLCRHFLQDNKHHIEAMRLLAAIGNKLNVLGDAEFLLESCVEFAPEYELARYDYANLLLKMQKFEKASEQTRILTDRQPENLGYKSLLANATAGVGDHQKAHVMLSST